MFPVSGGRIPNNASGFAVRFLSVSLLTGIACDGHDQMGMVRSTQFPGETDEDPPSFLSNPQSEQNTLSHICS